MIGGLGLKFVVSRGTYSRQTVAGVVQLHGADVNLLHRLLKNTVPLREHLLATAAAMKGWPPGAVAVYIDAPQRYDLGDVPAAYLDLAPVRADALREDRTVVTDAEAKLRMLGPIYRTDRVIHEGAGTRIDTAVYWEEPKGIKRRIGTLVAVRMMKKYFGEYDDRMDSILKEPAPAS